MWFLSSAIWLFNTSELGISVCRQQKREGGQSKEGVELPDSLANEVVVSVCAGPENPQSPSWWQHTEEAVRWGARITSNAESLADEIDGVNTLKGRERGTNIFFGCTHYALQGLPARHGVDPIQHIDAAGQTRLQAFWPAASKVRMMGAGAQAPLSLQRK